jgi:enediyne biosynthesis protein E4
MNEDGKIDLIIGGNEFGFHPQLGRLDASTGDVLINTGNNNFTVLNQIQSGLKLQGQVRDISLVKRNNKISILFLQNNEFPVLYELKKKTPIAKK